MMTRIFFTLFANLPSNRALVLDGTNYATTPSIGLSETSDWTIELDFVAFSGGTLIDDQGSTAGDGILIQLTGTSLQMTVNGVGSTNVPDFLSEELIIYGRHYHLAITHEYDSGTGLADFTWYLNGTKYPALTQVDYEQNNITTTHIGRQDLAAGYFQGWIDNVHMTEELLYTADFYPTPSPPTPTGFSQLLLTFDDALPGDATYTDTSGQGNDATAQGSSITAVDTYTMDDGYARLNGFSSVLTWPDFDISPGVDLTVEFDMRYFNIPGSMDLMTLFDAIDNDIASDGGLSIRFDPSTQFFQVTTKTAGNASIHTDISTAITPNTWTRCCMSLERTSATTSQLRFYVDGIRVFNSNVDYEKPSARELCIGATHNLAGTYLNFFNGHLDNIRISNVLRYSGADYNHYPGSIVDDVDTVALWNMERPDVAPGSFFDNSGNGATLFADEVEAAHTWAVPFWPSPDISPTPYTYVAPMPDLGASWTIEFWYNRLTNLDGVMFDAYDELLSNGLKISVDTSHNIIFKADGINYTLGALNANAWNHVVVQQRVTTPGAPPMVRVRAIIDGTAQTPTTPFSRVLPQGTHLLLGNNDAGSSPLAGSISELRISSVPRYGGDAAPSRSTLGSDLETLGVWSMDEPTGSSLIDRSPYQRDFQLCDGAVTFTSQPVDQSTCAGENVQFSTTTLDTITTFQWRKDGVEIPNETNNTLVLVNVSAADEGVYDCIVSIGCDTVISDPGTFTLADNYVFDSWPGFLDVCVGDDVDMTVSVILQTKMAGTYSLQWLKDGVVIPGATAETYSITNAQLSDQGFYECRLQSFSWLQFSIFAASIT